jgi:hypothetical protein
MRFSRMTIGALCVAVAVTLAFAACSSQYAVGENAIKGKSPDAFVDMHEVQAAYIGSGSGGGGTLFYQGNQYPFTVGGLGVGGIGLSTIEASGDVYNLPDLAQFPGTYGEARYGFAFGEMSKGDLWLQNEKGVILHLKAKRTGLILSLGGDAVVIAMTPQQ